MEKAIERLNSDEEPVLALQGIGHDMLATAEVAWLALAAIDVVKEAGVLLNELTDAATGWKSALGAAVDRAFELLKMVFLVVLSMAFFLAFYLPTLPFVLWILSVAGWFSLADRGHDRRACLGSCPQHPGRGWGSKSSRESGIHDLP
ncbi:MAG: hypothetical protein LC541_18760 [Candidatus Thiodiazotropha sp.]|nr:hypothetical protein [Candidatus Thiodiazotropha sp.]MCM8885310.1 hypothetical protein [Candidatus Thiodiazotropha sp.]MCM8921573.1 hypothetical protein [Candidatus Thiodiazotropha sp.]